jgi:hypothetical protein
MSLGKMNGIEDIAIHAHFDADVAEALVVLAGSDSITHSYLKQSSAFQKICVKVGFESP